MTTPTATGLIRNGNHVGERIELGRYTAPTAGERIIYGQRVNGVVSFLPGACVVLVRQVIGDEGGACCSRPPVSDGARPDAVRQKRPTRARATVITEPAARRCEES